MYKLKINGAIIAKMPFEFDCAILDLDYNNSSSFGRSISGDLNRNYLATKRKLTLKYNALKWSEVSALLQQMVVPSFTVYYPDIYTGTYETKSFYVSDRKGGVVKTSLSTDLELYWGAMTFTLVEM